MSGPPTTHKTIEAFASHYGKPLDKTYDVRRGKPSVYVPAMLKAGAIYAYNLKPCKGEMGGLHLTVKGIGSYRGCMQCYPQSMGHEKDHVASGYVYLAVSRRTEHEEISIVKVGSCGNLSDRVYRLNLESYGGVADWHIIAQHFEASIMGGLETRVKARLKAYAYHGTYRDDQEAREMFRVKRERALAIFAQEVAR